jgi:cold shock CspA family protein
MLGVVKFFNQEKMFGFIAAEDGKSYHFHNADVEYNYLPGRVSQRPIAGDSVEFEIEIYQDKLKARKIKILSKPM